MYIYIYNLVSHTLENNIKKRNTIIRIRKHVNLNGYINS